MTYKDLGKKIADMFSTSEVEESLSNGEELSTEDKSQEETKENFADFKTRNGEIVRVEDKNELEEGDKLMRVAEDGSVEPAEDGAYILDDGRAVTVSEGSIKALAQTKRSEEGESSEGDEGSSEEKSEEEMETHVGEVNPKSDENDISTGNVGDGQAEEKEGDVSNSMEEDEKNQLKSRIDTLESMLKEIRDKFSKVDEIDEIKEQMNKIADEPAKPKAKKPNAEKFHGQIKEESKNKKESAAQLIAKAKSKKHSN